MIYPLNRHYQLLRSLTLLCCVLLLTMAVSAQQQQQKTADDYVAAGVVALRAGKHEEALKQNAEALKLDPKNFGAQFNSGFSYMMLRKFEDALTAFKAAAALKPSERARHRFRLQ